MSIGLVQILLAVGLPILFKVAIRKRNTANTASIAGRGGGRGGEGREEEEEEEREGKECREEREEMEGREKTEGDRLRRGNKEVRTDSDIVQYRRTHTTYICKYTVVYPHTEICNKV